MQRGAHPTCAAKVQLSRITWNQQRENIKTTGRCRVRVYCWFTAAKIFSLSSSILFFSFFFLFIYLLLRDDNEWKKLRCCSCPVVPPFIFLSWERNFPRLFFLFLVSEAALFFFFYDELPPYIGPTPVAVTAINKLFPSRRQQKVQVILLIFSFFFFRWSPS